MSQDPHTWAWIALGANLGNAAEQVSQAIDRLQALSNQAICRSSLWRSAPEDCPPGSPDFINAAAGLIPLPNETPESLLEKLQTLEQEFGRRPKKVLNEPRPLDLDLIAFGNEVRATPHLTLPHPRAHTRAFVLQPLAEIAPDLVLPGQTRSVGELLRELPTATVCRYSVL